MLEKTFGIKKSNTIYKERTGAYGIGFSADGKIPVAMTHLYNGEKGYFYLIKSGRLNKYTILSAKAVKRSGRNLKG